MIQTTDFDPKVLPVNIVPRNDAADAFEIGFQIAKLRWHLRAAIITFSHADEQEAKHCSEMIQPLLCSLFPEQRGGRGYELVDCFRRTWTTLHTDTFAEAFVSAFNDDDGRCEAENIVNQLRPLIPPLDEALLLTLNDVWQGSEPRLLRALHLGRCVGEGIYPRLNEEDLLETVDNPEFAQRCSEAGRGFATVQRAPGRQRTCSMLIQPKYLHAGDIEPDATWGGELHSLLDANGLLEVQPGHLDFLEQSPQGRIDTISVLCAKIKENLQAQQSRGSELDWSPLLPEATSPALGSNASASSIAISKEHQVDEAISETAPTDNAATDSPKGSENQESAVRNLQTPIEKQQTGSSSQLPQTPGQGKKKTTLTWKNIPGRNGRSRIVSFRGQPAVFTRQNAKLLKAIVGGRRWPTEKEVCDAIYPDSKVQRDKLVDRHRAARSRLNKQIQEQFQGLSEDWLAVQTLAREGETLLIVKMPDEYRPPAGSDDCRNC